jgi:NAD(P)-dependent dehydrogenase (short-subunit alcohol dehydrogenase family)
MQSTKLSNVSLVITGGAKGLGKAMVKTFMEKGVTKIAICDKNKDELEQTLQELGTNVIGFTADTTNESDVSDFAQKVVAKFGRIDIWINNAGVWMPPQALEDIDVEKAKNLFQVNVFGTINGMRVAIRVMKSQQKQSDGIENKSAGGRATCGTIVNIISTTAFDGMTGSSGSMYVASKYALRGLTNMVREELKKDTVHSGQYIEVIGVYPGGMKTDIFNSVIPENFDQFMSAEEIAHKIVENLEKPEPESQLVLARPGQKLSWEIKIH